jgi:hypothetical protein
VAASAPTEQTRMNDTTAVTTNGHQSPGQNSADPTKASNGSPKRSIEEDEDNELPDAPPPPTSGDSLRVTGEDGDEDANSEAETVLTSPVKKREAEKRVSAIKQERAEQPEISAQHAMDDDDDEADAPGSPDDSAAPVPAASPKKTTSHDLPGDDQRRNREQSSESLSDVDPTRSDDSDRSSPASSKSRARSERPGSRINSKDSPNPRKRKHRASSVNLPNKRPSMDVAKRRLRDLHSEGANGHGATGRSPSPGRKGHRRAASTQSAVYDGASEAHGIRKRRAVTQFPLGESKPVKATWEESSVSSETTSHGHGGDVPARRRGIGRSTSTPGRPAGREHKRHINKYGFTKLAEACEDGDLDLVKEWREKDPDQLEIEEFAKNTPLQIASLNGNSEVVEYLIDQGCRVDCANVDKDTPLIDAAENGHSDVVDILLNAGVDPLRQNLKGQQALDVVTDDTENAAEIRASLRRAMEKWDSVDARKRREHEEEKRFSGRPSEALHFMARTYENLHKLVVNNDRNSVREFLDAHVPVDNNIIAAAARTGDSYLINMLLAEMSEKKAHQKPEKPLLSVLGTSHLETVKSLTELDQFNPLWTNRQGKTWPEIADERRGPMWVQESELLHRLYNEARKKAERQSSSPVNKREEVKRRPPPQSGDHSTDKSPPKRKNGKRLMSRREMRAASGKPFSDSSEDDSSSETAKEADDGMKPPESPNTKRGPGRPRTKSASTQPSTSPLEAGRTRRRSSSVREKAEPRLPIVDEQMEDVDAAVTNKSADIDDNKMDVEETGVEVEAKAKQEEDDTRRKEADAKKKEEEDARKEEEADAKTREVEENARKAEAERAAKEKRQIEIEAEEQRQAEEMRKAEEQRQKLERELSEAKSKHRSDLASTLPDALSRFLSPDLGASTERSRLENEVLTLFTPLQALPGLEVLPIDSQQHKSRMELFVLNVQAAPLLGKAGLDLLLRPDAPGFEKSIAHEWTTLPLADDERECVRAILPSHLLSTNPMDEDQTPIEDGLSFQAELERMARRMRKVQDAQAKFDAADIVLRWVKLQDVLDNLHHALQGTTIEVRTDFRRPEDHARVLKDIRAKGTTGFFDNVCEWWKQEALTKEVTIGRTEVKVTHEK